MSEALDTETRRNILYYNIGVKRREAYHPNSKGYGKIFLELLKKCQIELQHSYILNFLGNFCNSFKTISPDRDAVLEIEYAFVLT